MPKTLIFTEEAPNMSTKIGRNRVFFSPNQSSQHEHQLTNGFWAAMKGFSTGWDMHHVRNTSAHVPRSATMAAVAEEHFISPTTETKSLQNEMSISCELLKSKTKSQKWCFGLIFTAQKALLAETLVCMYLRMCGLEIGIKIDTPKHER